MKIAILAERRPGETRVAATPETVKKYKGLGIDVTVEAGAGTQAAVPDEAFEAAGAEIAKDAKSAASGAEVILKVRKPMTKGDGKDEMGVLDKGQHLIAMLDPYQSGDQIKDYASKGVNAFAMELMPRITRAQSMDVLSSQSNLAGYRAVIEAAQVFGRAFPMMMTAAGTVAPARVTVLGVGVAGLQAIATARRLGGVVSATDVRLATKEQVQSLGANWIEVEGAEDMETEGGYAKEVTEDFRRKQQEAVTNNLKKADVAITTALIPGRKAPELISEEMVRQMKPGAVIIDMAVEQGGNCPLSKMDEIVDVNGVKVVGAPNLAARVPADASQLYAKNLLTFFQLIWDAENKALKIDWEDEIVKGIGLTRDGAVVHPSFAEGS